MIPLSGTNLISAELFHCKKKKKKKKVSQDFCVITFYTGLKETTGPPQFPVFHAVPIKLPSDCHEPLHLSLRAQWRCAVHNCSSSPVPHWPALTLLML